MKLLNRQIIELEFEADTHAYRLEGWPVLSVTQVLDRCGITSLGNVSERILKFAQRRGTAVHLACQYDDQGILDYCPPSIAGYLAGWRAFKELYKPVFELMEQPVYHRGLWYAGTLDRRVICQGKRILIDIKSGNIQLEAGSMQLSAYKEAHDTLFPAEPVEQRMLVHVTSNGKFKVYGESQLLSHDLAFAKFKTALQQAGKEGVQ